MILTALNGIKSLPQVAGALAVGVVAGYLYGHVAAGASAERAALRKANAQLQADQKTALEIQTRMAEAASALREKNETLRKEADALEQSFRDRPNPACVLSNADLVRLRRFADGPQRRTNPATGQRIAPPLRLPGAVP